MADEKKIEETKDEKPKKKKGDGFTRRQRHLNKRRKRCTKCKKWGFRTVKKIDGVLYAVKCRHCGHHIQLKEEPKEVVDAK